MIAGTWTDERVELLKQLWAGGMSGTDIGLRFGIARGAVIAKVHRLGIAERTKTPKHARAERGTQQGKANAARKAKARQAAKPQSPTTTAFCFRTRDATPNPSAAPAPSPKRLSAGIPPAPAPHLVSVLGLTSAMCHWPIDKGDDDTWRYRGAPRDPRSAANGKAYCTHHHARLIDDASRQRFLARGR